MDRAFVFLLGVGFARLVGLAFNSADVVVVSDPTACLSVEGELAQCMHEINGMIRGEACVEEARRTGLASCWPANHMIVPHHRVVDLFVLAEGREDVCAVDIVDEWLGCGDGLVRRCQFRNHGCGVRGAVGFADHFPVVRHRAP